MTDYSRLGAREAIATADAARVSVCWDFASMATTDVQRLRKYCPCCKQFNTLRAITASEGNGNNNFECRSCGHHCKRPAVLSPRGPAQQSTAVGRISNSAQLVAAMEASEVLNAVDRLSADLRVFILWMYTDPADAQRDTLQGLVMLDLSGRLDDLEAESLKGMQAYGDVYRVMEMVMSDYRSRMRCNKRLFTNSAIAEKIGRDKSQFSGKRLWARIIAAIVAELDAMDRMGLQPVAEVLQSMQEEAAA